MLNLEKVQTYKIHFTKYEIDDILRRQNEESQPYNML